MREKMLLGSLFDGQGTACLAALLSGVEPIWASEIEPAVIKVTKARFPEMKHYGDVSSVKGAEIEPVDIITFGSPCFVAGSLVTTDRGLIPIEDIKIGDSVLTHRNRFMKVTDWAETGTKSTMHLKAMGVDEIIATPNHKFYVRERIVKHGKRYRRFFSDPAWKPLEELTNDHFVGMAINKEAENKYNLTAQECWLIGRYIADGSVEDNIQKDGYIHYRTQFAVGKKKYDEFMQHAEGLTVQTVKRRNVFTCRIAGERLAKLCALCGKGAINKELPPFLLNLPPQLLKFVIDGYLSGDGYDSQKGLNYRMTTVSKKLVYSLMQAIAKCFRMPCSISVVKRSRQHTIKGRVVNEQLCYYLSFKKERRKGDIAFYDDGYLWTPIRSIKKGELRTVYNISVKGDESYCIQNTIVHNCQDLSVAGKRQGMKHSLKGDDDSTRSGLFFDAVRIIEEMREATLKPRFACWENVMGCLSSAKGEDFRRVLEELCQVKDINAEVPLIKWPGNGEIIGKDYSLAWRAVDLQHFGCPQRRRRIYLLVDYDGHTAGKIMFRNEGLEFHAKQRAWTEFVKDTEPMTAKELTDLFNGETISILEREENEPSGKFARFDMNSGLWDTTVPEGYFIGEKPYYQNKTKLSEILIENADPKYYLSAKACQGILRRARERNKELPEALRKALENQARGIADE